MRVVCVYVYVWEKSKCVCNVLYTVLMSPYVFSVLHTSSSGQESGSTYTHTKGRGQERALQTTGNWFTCFLDFAS